MDKAASRIRLRLTFVYRWLLPSRRKAKQRAFPAHYQAVVLVWLKLAFLSDFYFIRPPDYSITVTQAFSVNVTFNLESSFSGIQNIRRHSPF